ncbi:helix-turn-helix domain-containing protein [Plantibacter flavus]|uniref:helix-turn-helix domain-containing protein n=1 Tax=Plantibacter flavus TaxID=150123 RepID=UPI003F5CCFDA
MLYREALGAVLRRRRLEQGRTLQDVATAAAVSTPYLSEVERGRKDASSEVVATIADALRTRLDLVMFDVADRIDAAPVLVLDPPRRADESPIREDDDTHELADATVTELRPSPDAHLQAA